MPSGPVAHISFLVNNLDQAIDDFDGGGDKMHWCTSVSDHGVEIQLMERDPASKLGQRLAKKGENVHHICLTTPTLDRSLAERHEKGIELTGEIAGDPNMPWQRWGWVSAKSAHGILLEIAAPYETRDDGNWHPATEAIAAE